LHVKLENAYSRPQNRGVWGFYPKKTLSCIIEELTAVLMHAYTSHNLQGLISSLDVKSNNEYHILMSGTYINQIKVAAKM